MPTEMKERVMKAYVHKDVRISESLADNLGNVDWNDAQTKIATVAMVIAGVSTVAAIVGKVTAYGRKIMKEMRKNYISWDASKLVKWKDNPTKFNALVERIKLDWRFERRIVQELYVVDIVLALRKPRRWAIST